ncbi:ATP-binding protein [Brevibacillus fluminis]|uniref:ATP-binding protein n=1 Tax=Brevibacillus fluminis TaxID=511487 RepID=UPI003F8A6EAA
MYFFRKMGFQQKMLLSYLLMMLLIGTVALLYSYQMTKITTDELRLSQRILPQTSALLNLKNQLYSKTYALKMYAQTREPVYLEKYYSGMLQRNLLDQIVRTKENERLFTIASQISELDFIFFNKIDPLLKAKNVDAVTYVLKTEVEPRIMQLEQVLAFTLQSLETDTNAEFQQTNTSMQVALIITYTVSVAAILFGLFSAFYFRKQLLHPIESLIQQMRQVSRGAFGKQITHEARDEFFELASEFNKMSKNVAELFLHTQRQNQILTEEKQVREQILNTLPVGVITYYTPSNEVHLNEKAQTLVELNETFLPKSPTPDIWARKDGDGPGWFENRKITLYKPDGSTFLALVSYAPLVQQDGSEIGWMMVLSDITEQEKIQAYMHQSEKLSLVGQLAAGAAHEIRNPLTVIYGFMQLLEKNLTEEYRSRYYVPLIIQEIERVNRIVTELLMLSKPSQPNYREVTLEEVVSAILPLMKGEAALHNIMIQETYEKDAFLHVDVEQFKQILLNLMKNSLEAMPDGGTLTIESTQDADKLFIAVTDTGIGMSPEQMTRIFEPFYSDKDDGTGLGLPITMRMIQNHGGDLQVKSEVGKGTTFTIILPKKPHESGLG